MEIEIIRVLVGLEELLGKQGGLFSHGDGLHGQHIAGAGSSSAALGAQITVKIGDAVAIAGALARQHETTELRTGFGGIK